MENCGYCTKLNMKRLKDVRHDIQYNCSCSEGYFQEKIVKMVIGEHPGTKIERICDERSFQLDTRV